MILAFLQALRPRQWTKNLLLFAGLVFARKWDEPALVLNVALGFVVFCALSGVVYIVNDLLDQEKDREHPKKRFRPIASGALSPKAAVIGAALLLVGALALSWTITLGFFVCAVLYVLLVCAYSLHLKHLVILDVMVLALGFVLRAVAGIEALHEEGFDPVPITPYFILTTLFLALFLAIAKRRSELLLLGQNAREHRRVLGEYSEEFCDIILTLATTGVIFSYALWATTGSFAAGGALGQTPQAGYGMVFTMPFVLYGIFRYLWLVFKYEEGGAPETLLLKDKALLITVVFWLGTVVAILALSQPPS